MCRACSIGVMCVAIDEYSSKIQGKIGENKQDNKTGGVSLKMRLKNLNSDKRRSQRNLFLSHRRKKRKKKK